MADKEEAITKREEKKRQEKEAICNQFVDLAKKAIEVEEGMAKATEAEAKLMAEERDIVRVRRYRQHDGGTKGLGGEAACHHPTTRRVISHLTNDLCLLAWNLCAFA
jgi:hypothetical protein